MLPRPPDMAYPPKTVSAKTACLYLQYLIDFPLAALETVSNYNSSHPEGGLPADYFFLF